MTRFGYQTNIVNEPYKKLEIYKNKNTIPCNQTQHFSITLNNKNTFNFYFDEMLLLFTKICNNISIDTSLFIICLKTPTDKCVILELEKSRNDKVSPRLLFKMQQIRIQK
jgi:hypothetical protein